MSVLAEIELTLKSEIKTAIITAELASEAEVPEVSLEKSKEKSHGDFASNIAMQLARIAKKAPRQIAEDIVQHLDMEKAGITKVDIAGPGFINFFMKDNFLGDIVPVVIKQGTDYGSSEAGNKQRVQVEFVSVNPTGDLHLGHARGAAFGDVLCNVFAASGYEVDREYYINDAGNQIDNLAYSIDVRYKEALGQEAEMPDDGYFGQDIINIGQELAEKDGDKWLQKGYDTRVAYFRDYGLTYELDQIKADLDAFGVHFDRWFSELSLYENEKIIDALSNLQENGYTYEKDGATWFKSTTFGDDKDRVLIKQDGTYTYLTPDIAYHKDKLERGYDKLINVWGADHHGYVPRMRAAIQALGYEKEKFSVSIIQMVNVVEDGKVVRMSKRTGRAVTLRELIDDVGVDAVRYFFIMRSNDSQLDFDVDLARSESNENPVFYVQYAHARICTMLKQAETKGFTLTDNYDATLLQSEKEQDLLKQLAELPQVIADAAEKEAPYRLTQYVYDLATMLHSFYNAEKVINEDDLALTEARIALMTAVRTTIANALKLIGVYAPEKM